MRGRLEYASADDGPYKVAGTLRAIDQDYKVVPVEVENRAGELEQTGFNVQVSALLITQNTDLLDETEWYWRIKFENDLVMIKLGEHPYTISYDAQLRRNTVKYHRVKISFFINYDEYEDYAIPENLPESEGGVYVDGGEIYID